jgi:eukaryotic-like serine/threonine-protein kinase
MGSHTWSWEYVHGVHLDQYCDTKKLGIRERIELFLQVCDAVAYAHRNLIVTSI